jgi:hypothetical protein
VRPSCLYTAHRFRSRGQPSLDRRLKSAATGRRATETWTESQAAGLPAPVPDVNRRRRMSWDRLVVDVVKHRNEHGGVEGRVAEGEVLCLRLDRVESLRGRPREHGGQPGASTPAHRLTWSRTHAGFRVPSSSPSSRPSKRLGHFLTSSGKRIVPCSPGRTPTARNKSRRSRASRSRRHSRTAARSRPACRA